MIELETPRFSIGDTVWVLCRYDYYNTPSLLNTTIIAVRFGVSGNILYQFAGWDAKDTTIAIWPAHQAAEAHAALAESITAHQHRHEVHRS